MARLFGGVIGGIDNGKVDVVLMLLSPLGYGISDEGQPHIVEQSHRDSDLDLFGAESGGTALSDCHQGNGYE